MAYDGDPLDRVQAYQLARQAIEDANVDGEAMLRDPLAKELASQLTRAACSIAANIAEGYSRGTPGDRRRFFEYALGSVPEAIVWYAGARLPDPAPRLARLESIRRLLLTMIRTTRNATAADTRKFSK